MIKAKVSLEIASIRIDPLASDKLAILELADVLLASFEVDVGALSVFLPVGPVSRVDIFVSVSHDTLAVSLTTLPVAIVLADLGVHLLADSMLVVVNPGALVLNGLLLRVGPCVGVITLSMTFLKVQLESVTSLKLIHDQMSDLHHRGNHLYKCRQWDRLQCLFRSIHEKMFSLVYIHMID